MTRDDVIRMAREAGGGLESDYTNISALQQFAALVADAERIKYQTEIQRLTDLANTAEKWRGIAMAKDGDGRTVQMVQEEARSAEREECAKVCEESELAFNIDVWCNSTKKEMTANTANALAAAIRARGAAGKESGND